MAPAPVPYESDPAKRRENPRIHQGVTFDDGYRVLMGNPHSQLEFCDRRQAETRWITIGPLPDRADTLLHVTWREGAHLPIRIISVRRVTRKERNRHANRHRRPRIR
jgi:uncharacterized DUF497 family protein